jgi:hypothetical protein
MLDRQPENEPRPGLRSSLPAAEKFSSAPENRRQSSKKRVLSSH